MSNSVIRRRPNIEDWEMDKTRYQFNSLEELFEVEWIKETYVTNKLDYFIGLFVSENDGLPPLLMAKYVSSFWAIGYLENFEHLEEFIIKRD